MVPTWAVGPGFYISRLWRLGIDGTMGDQVFVLRFSDGSTNSKENLNEDLRHAYPQA